MFALYHKVADRYLKFRVFTNSMNEIVFCLDDYSGNGIWNVKSKGTAEYVRTHPDKNMLGGSYEFPSHTFNPENLEVVELFV